MPGQQGSSGFWHSAPGILTAVAGVLTALGGLVIALNQAGLLPRGDSLAAAPSDNVAVNTSALRDEGTSVPPNIGGRWRAHVSYPWGVESDEVFAFRVEGDRIAGTASYFGYPRLMEEVELRGDRISFTTRIEESFGEQTRTYENHYDGLVTQRGIDFDLYDTNGRGPIEFTMRRE